MCFYWKSSVLNPTYSGQKVFFCICWARITDSIYLSIYLSKSLILQSTYPSVSLILKVRDLLKWLLTIKSIKLCVSVLYAASVFYIVIQSEFIVIVSVCHFTVMLSVLCCKSFVRKEFLTIIIRIYYWRSFYETHKCYNNIIKLNESMSTKDN